MTKAMLPPSSALDHLFARSEAQHNLPPGLLKSIAWIESRFDTNAVAKQYDKNGKQNGGLGVMQFLASTAREYKLDPFNPMQAIDGAARYMANALKASKGDLATAVQMYNMGVSGAQKFLAGDKSVAGDPNYSTKVLGALGRLTNGQAAGGGQGRPAQSLISFDAPKTVDEAADFLNTSERAANATLDPVMLGPKQATWLEDIGELGMTSKLDTLFASLNGEQNAAARSRLNQLDNLLSDQPLG